MALGKCRECGREVSKSASVCPGCGVKKPVKHTNWVTIIGALVVMFVALKVCARSGDKSATEPASAAVGVAAEEAPAAPAKLDKLSAGTLLQAYTANEVAADAKYKGKRFQVTGSVVAVKSDITDDPQVWLVSELSPVVAGGLSKSFAGSLKKGTPIEAACTVQGSILGMPTLDCSGPQ